MRARQIVVTDHHQIDIEELDIDDSAFGTIAIDIHFSGISAGTELSVVKGTNARLVSARWSPDRDSDLVRLPGLTYPVSDLGYMEVGSVATSDDPAFPVGSTVALACGHRTGTVARPASGGVTLLPRDIEPLHGIWASTLLPICANGLLHAAAEFDPSGPDSIGSGVQGRRIAIFGAGVIGLILAYWTAQLDAQVIVVDRTPSRLQAAKALGLEVLLDNGRAAWEIRSAWRNGGQDAGADAVFQTRGTTEALATAIRSVRPGHPVIDLAFYQTDSTGLHLGEDFHHGGVVLRAAQIGNLPRALKSAWNRTRLVDEGLDLLRTSGSLLAEALVTDVVPLDGAPDLLLRMAQDRSGKTLQAVIDMEPGNVR